MPRRVVKRYRFEVEFERTPLSPALDRRLRKNAMARAAMKLSDWRKATEQIDKFCLAPSAVMAAYFLGNYAHCQELSASLLEQAPTFEDNWNCGNAIHFAHTALGLLALRSGDVQRAIQELHLSGETPGSPQLNSFGPSMHLARELLRAGELEPVLAYFQQCRRFWKLGETWLGLWEKKVARGAIPTFFAQLYR